MNYNSMPVNLLITEACIAVRTKPAKKQVPVINESATDQDFNKLLDQLKAL